MIGARRRDLILPQDGAPWHHVCPSEDHYSEDEGTYCLDQRDVVEYLSMVFASYQPDQLLWPMSSSTLRKRLNLLQTSLGMPTARSHDSCRYDLGSFRPGGATDLLQQFVTRSLKFTCRRFRQLHSTPDCLLNLGRRYRDYLLLSRTYDCSARTF